MFVTLSVHTKSASNSQMKTKALLLAGLVSLAGVAASQAQTVYSVNAVGFVNVSVPSGFSMIANPLQGSDNKISTLFAGVPNGTSIYKFNAQTGNYVINNFFFGWGDANMTLVPGEGAFIFNPTGSALTITFTGEVLQGSLSTPLTAGFSIVSSKVPQAGQLDSALGFPVSNGDSVYRYNNATGQYQISNYFFGWNTPPVVNVGESVFAYKTTATTWNRSFSVSN
jgi:hypothetical protein